jgi:hypothetical protein
VHFLASFQSKDNPKDKTCKSIDLFPYLIQYKVNCIMSFLLLFYHQKKTLDMIKVMPKISCSKHIKWNIEFCWKVWYAYKEHKLATLNNQPHNLRQISIDKKTRKINIKDWPSVWILYVCAHFQAKTHILNFIYIVLLHISNSC